MSKAMSERQRYWYEHLQRADEQQVSLAQYAREQGLGLKQLYGAKTWLVKLGAWPRDASRTTAQGSAFVSLRVSPSSVGVRCRISHVSGWSLECEGLPSAAWLRGLIADAAA
jgi:hypothetical protein